MKLRLRTRHVSRYRTMFVPMPTQLAQNSRRSGIASGLFNRVPMPTQFEWLHWSIEPASSKQSDRSLSSLPKERCYMIEVGEAILRLRAVFERRTTGFSEPERSTQRKSKRLVEGFACNPLLLPILMIQNGLSNPRSAFRSLPSGFHDFAVSELSYGGQSGSSNGIANTKPV